jgi:hypothetical protein
MSDRGAESLCGIVESDLTPEMLVVTDDWSGYTGLRKRAYNHHAIAECGDPEVAEDFLPIIHLVFANLKTLLIDIHHGAAFTSLSQRVHVPLKPALLPVQHLPFLARNGGRRGSANLYRALFWRLGPPYMYWVTALTG